MARITPAQKLTKKREAWLSRTMQALDLDETVALELLKHGRHQSVRLNPLIADPAQSLQAMVELGWQGTELTWCENGYTVDEGLQALRDSQLAADGAVLIQNAASWLPVLALDPQPGEAILDVCAAPGGKTSHLAALTDNKATIVANDNSRSRLMKLRAMSVRMAAHIDRFTLYDATSLARKFDAESFDRILIDAPCSGEGMMSYDKAKDFDTWSVAHVKRLQQLQKKVLVQACRLLKPGGTLVYSTCTMAPEEDEAVIDYGLRALEGVQIEPLEFDLPNSVKPVTEWNNKKFNPDVSKCLRLIPSDGIEAFFVCKLTKQL